MHSIVIINQILMPEDTSIRVLTKDFLTKFSITNHSFVGEGSQKQVFLVERNGKKCILKLFKNFGLRDIGELDIYDKYNHLNGIPKILEIQKHGTETIVFEEEILGDSLEKIKLDYKGNAKTISELLLNIVDILEPLWINDIVHRDLKPSNIIVQKENKPFVIDFGIAKNPDNSSITTVSFQPHTWKFCAPEQFFAQKDNISYRTDFFALGIIAYYLYFQELPFGDTRESVEEYFSKKKIEIALDEDCKIKNIVDELLKFSPTERPAKITKLREILKI